MLPEDNGTCVSFVSFLESAGAYTRHILEQAAELVGYEM